MMDYKEIPQDGEIWELFARDFLEKMGFIIESGPDRGPDGGKDIIAREMVKGNLGNHEFRWLISCKHNAWSNKSVTENDEPNILERVNSFKTYGFIGFYSTIPSSGLNSRLSELKKNGCLNNYRILDSKSIENYCLSIGFSNLLMRYFPESYKKLKPLHILFDKYYPLQCVTCGKDLLAEMYNETYSGNIISKVKDEGNGNTLIRDVYCACKTPECDKKENSDDGFHTIWEDLADVCIPPWYLKWICTIMNNLKSGVYKYSEKAFENEKHILLAIGQKVLREMTIEEKSRIKDLHLLSNLWK
jgi:hypothetical protein